MSRYREQLQHETGIELVLCTAGQARPETDSLVTVEREVRLYSNGVSDPMLRFPATSSLAPSSPVSPPPSSLPVSPAPVTGSPEVYWRVELEHWSTQH